MIHICLFTEDTDQPERSSKNTPSRLDPTTNMPTNSAAWILEPRGYPLVVKDAPYPTAEPGEIIVKNHALGVNPADYKIQDTDMFQSKYPDIQGYEVAGEVVAVGNNVDGISVGQRVTGLVPS
jgi:NADPH:quinone reductase-like Zn-dependent oxidoreductase